MTDRPGFLATVRADLAAMAELKKVPWPSAKSLADVLMLPATWAVILFRVADTLHRAGLRPLSRITYFLNMVLFGVDIAPGTTIGPGLTLGHPVGLAISKDVVIGRNARLFGGVLLGGSATEDPSKDGFPTIGDDVWVFSQAKVFGPIKIGDRAMITAGSLVVQDVPPNAVVFGTPARVMRYRDEPQG